MSIEPDVVFKTLNKEIFNKWIMKHNDDLFTENINLSESHLRKKSTFQLSVNSYLYFPDLYREPIINGLLSLTKVLPAKQVYVGTNKNQHWTEYQFPENNNILESLFWYSELRPFLFSIIPHDKKNVKKTEAWINQYGQGEYIARHKDSAGTLQVLIGLQNAAVNPPEGCLFVGNQMIKLNAGDLLIFRAHEIPHYTIPLKQNSCNDRINAVLRFHIQQP